MESRLLEACREGLASNISERVQIVDAGSPGRDRCDLLIENPSRERKRTRLVVDLAPARACLYLARPEATESGNDPLHRAVVGKWIVDVDCPAPAPLLRLVLSSPGADDPTEWLIFEWLGGRPEALLVDAKSETVIETLREDDGPHAMRRSRGAKYEWPPATRRPGYREATTDSITSILTSHPGKSDLRSLARGFADLPLFLAYEALSRGNGDPEAIATALREIADAEFDPVLYRIKNDDLDLPIVFVSPIPLPSMEKYRSNRPGSFFHLLEHAHEAVLRAETEASVHESFQRLLNAEERRLMRLHKQLSAESKEASTAKQLRQNAEALLVHLDDIPRGADRFTCKDPADAKKELEITLDPSQSASANAKRMFRKAKRLERGEPIRRKRLKALEETVARLSVLRERSKKEGAGLSQKGGGWLRETLGKFGREHSIAAWESQVGAAPGKDRPKRLDAPKRPRRATQRPEERFHPRKYTTSEGWSVLVGRSNAENDHVTHALAHPEDYWFHAEGCPGSHVVLRREGRKDNPSGRTIEEAAAIAAYFSKARTSRKAPVVYTLKKYVRKPRKSAPGLALLMREKMIMVEPKAPEDRDPGGWGDEEEND